MGTKRGLERLIFFTDAVVAIAITLLILPLVDAVASSHSFNSFFVDHLAELISFAISFAVIARLWAAHHAIFEHVEGYNTTLFTLTLLWTFTIVLLPLPTALTAEFRPSVETVGFYVGTMSANSLLLTIIAWTVRHNPQLESPARPVSNRQLAGTMTTTAAFIVALAIGLAFPAVNYFALFLLVITGPVDIFVTRQLDRHAPETAK